MNPQDALKLVQEQEEKRRQEAVELEKRDSWRLISRQIAIEFGLTREHITKFSSDMMCWIPYCVRCGGDERLGTLDAHGPCVLPYSEDVGAAFELVDYITERGWSVQMMINPRNPNGNVIIQSIRNDSRLVQIYTCGETPARAIVAMASEWSRKQKESK